MVQEIRANHPLRSLLSGKEIRNLLRPHRNNPNWLEVISRGGAIVTDLETGEAELEFPDERPWKHWLVGPAEIEWAVLRKVPFVYTRGAGEIIGRNGCSAPDIKKEMNDTLDAAEIYFYDAEIREEIHGRPQHGFLDDLLETAALSSAVVRIFELSPHATAENSIFEAVFAALQSQKQDNYGKRGSTNILFWNNLHRKASGPADFIPLNMENEASRKRHYKQYEQSANTIRQKFFDLAQASQAINRGTGNGSITIAKNETEFATRSWRTSASDDFKWIIYPDRHHGADLLKALYFGLSGKPVLLYFKDAPENTLEFQNTPKEKMYPTFTLPPYTQQCAEEYLKQYQRDIAALHSTFYDLLPKLSKLSLSSDSTHISARTIMDLKKG